MVNPLSALTRIGLVRIGAGSEVAGLASIPKTTVWGRRSARDGFSNSRAGWMRLRGAP